MFETLKEWFDNWSEIERLEKINKNLRIDKMVLASKLEVATRLRNQYQDFCKNLKNENDNIRGINSRLRRKNKLLIDALKGYKEAYLGLKAKEEINE